MVGLVTLSTVEKKILLTALDGKVHGEDAIEFVPGPLSDAEGGRHVLTGLVLRDLLTWNGANTYSLTSEGLLTASALRTRVLA